MSARPHPPRQTPGRLTRQLDWLAIGLLAAVLLLGARTRRLARQPLPETGVRDEHWFLRHKKPGDPVASQRGSVATDAEAGPSREATDDAGEA